MPRLCSLLLPGLLAAQILACGGSGECTLLGCDHQAIVTLPGGAVTGPYDLYVTDGLQMLTARCNDPESEEAAENPAELSCDAAGFEIVGHPLANERSVRITVIDVDSGEVTVSNAEVFLDVVDTLQPNGEDCEPTCYVRNGQVLATGP